MKNKSETLTKFKEFKKSAESEIGRGVRCLRTDNGGEYKSDEFLDFIREAKIRQQFTCPDTPQQNGVSERKNRHLAKICRSMLHAKNVPGQFWAEAMKTAAFVINRLPQQSFILVVPSKEVLPDSGVLEEALEDSQIKLISEIEATNGNQDVKESATKILGKQECMRDKKKKVNQLKE
ncbi:UNVERIFIED_CONTAM: Retrovirus-related Pol polyprotein from transposon RE2 [Sesamum radiatum]|uniref:Retrovirus-related Pol polyprotein from transposon RE2 n=1 Tax=Sesamum radiatum TaxID=300843 RepID=A0AAW2RE99_SESRA